MANKPSPEKVLRSMRVQRILDDKVKKQYRVDKNMTVTDCYILALQYATRGVELPPETLEKIAREMREAAKGRRRE